MHGMLDDGAMSCPLNPASYRERYWDPEKMLPAAKSGRVVVVGGGPGGLEAARVSAERGHEVTLIEARHRLGGALALWAGLPGREFYGRSIEWWRRELDILGVEVRLGTTATAQGILDEEPDAVILATGALYSRSGHGNFRDQPIPGHGQAFVCTPEEVLLGTANPAGRVVILDGEGLNAGVGVAEVLATRGCDVEFLTPGFSPVGTRVRGTEETRFIMQRLLSSGVKITTNSYIGEIGDHQVSVFNVYSEEQRLITEVDAVVLATGRQSVNQLERELDGKVAQLFAIGDAAAARMWAAASYEGHLFARHIGEPGAPASLTEAYFEPFDTGLFPIPGDMIRG
jgi:dimethylamine/trimethylamine dehydrogenase